MNNPNTPLAYISPKHGTLVPLGQYFGIAGFAIFLLDVVDHSRDDWLLFSRKGFTKMNTVFLISRVTTLLLNVDIVLTFLTPLRYCAQNRIAGILLFIIHRASTSALFYARVMAVYPRNRFIKFAFTILWLIVVAGAILIVHSLPVTRIGPTDYCISGIEGPNWQFIAIVATDAFFDLMVCLAVTYQLQFHDRDRGAPTGWKGRFGLRKRGNAPLIDRFLRDSQLYFILTACVKVPELVAVIILPSFLPYFSILQVAMGGVDATVINIIAARVYRNMKLEKRGLLPFESTVSGPTFIELAQTSSLKFSGNSPLRSDHDHSSRFTTSTFLSSADSQTPRAPYFESPVE